MKTFFIKIRKKDIFISFFLSLFFILLAICIVVFCKYLYYFDIGYLHIDELTGLPVDVIKRNYDVLIDYQSLFFNGPLILPDFVMSNHGSIHFEEVKRIFEGIQFACLISGIVSLILVGHSLYEREYRFLKLTSLLTIGIPTVLGFFVALDFEGWFLFFHKLVFSNTYWYFEPSVDPIILILPERFFMHSFFMILFLLVMMSYGCMKFYQYESRKVLKNSKESLEI